MKKIAILLAAIAGLQVHAQSWSTTGNAGTNSATNFIGTTDNQPLVFKINGAEKMKLSPNGRLVFLIRIHKPGAIIYTSEEEMRYPQTMPEELIMLT